MIQVSHLVKRYGQRLAVDDLSFRVEKGEIVGFLGPNGAGKSTTLRILAGFLGMTRGEVKICGHDVREESFEARRAIGYMPEAVPLYTEMRVAEYLTFRAELKHVAARVRRSRVDDALEKANLTDVANLLIGKLSKGYRQRVGLADALVANPPLLILDEPTAGLDPNQIREVRDVILQLAGEHTVLLSTHILSEVEASCGRVIVIAKGRLVAEGPTKELQAMRRANGLDVLVRGDASIATQSLAAIDGVASVSPLPSSNTDVVPLRVTFAKTASTEAIGLATERAVAALIAAGLPIREVKPVGSSLEEVFSELTRSDASKEAVS